jgi:hypothetical protein
VLLAVVRFLEFAKKHNGKLMGRALGIFGLWLGGLVVRKVPNKTHRKLGGWCSWPDWVVVCVCVDGDVEHGVS